MRKIVALGALVALAVVPMAVAQDDATPLSWLAFNKTNSGKGMEFIQAIAANDGPMYDQLMADGQLMSWGIAIPITHNVDDEWNMVTWATFPDWGGVSDLQAGFMGLFGSRSPEKTAELDDLYKDSVVPGSHHDWIVSHEVIKTNPEKKPNYFDIGYHKAKMGQGEGVINWYKKNVVPINDQLMADGTIAGYGMYTMELHGSTEYTHVTWATMTDTAEIDAVQAAFDAALSPEVYAEVIGMVEMDAHRDQLLLIVHLGGQPAEE